MEKWRPRDLKHLGPSHKESSRHRCQQNTDLSAPTLSGAIALCFLSTCLSPPPPPRTWRLCRSIYWSHRRGRRSKAERRRSWASAGRKGLPWIPAEPPWAPPNGTFPRPLSVLVGMGCHQDRKARGLERFVREQRSLPLSQLSDERKKEITSGLIK